MAKWLGRGLMLGLLMMACLPAWALPEPAADDPIDLLSGVTAFQRQDYILARELWEPLAQAGHPKAQYYMSLLIEKYWGGEVDDAIVLDYLAKSARGGYRTARFNLGNRYMIGKGVQEDHEQAAYWWRLAAEQGMIEAQYNLGLLYYYGRGVAKDVSLALYWIKASADGGSVRAERALMAIREEQPGLSPPAVRPKVSSKAPEQVATVRSQPPAVAGSRPDVEPATGSDARSPGGERSQQQPARQARVDAPTVSEARTPVPPNPQRAEEPRSQSSSSDPIRRQPEPSRPAVASPRPIESDGPTLADAERSGSASVPVEVPAVGAPAVDPVQRSVSEPVAPMAQNTSSPAKARTAGTDTPAAKPSPAIQEAGRLRDAEWLMSQAAGGYTLQLFASQDADRVARYLLDKSFVRDVAVYAFQKSGALWQAVVYGVFPDRESARAAMAELPMAVRVTKPWLVAMADVQQRIRANPN